MTINTFSPTFKMSGTSFRELPAELALPESSPTDYVNGPFTYTARFNDVYNGELIWRITQANANNGSGQTWQAVHFDELIEAMRVEPLDPMTHRRRLDYVAFGVLRAPIGDWKPMMSMAMRDFVASRDLLVYLDHYIYPSAKLLAKMEPLRRADD